MKYFNKEESRKVAKILREKGVLTWTSYDCDTFKYKGLTYSIRNTYDGPEVIRYDD